MAKKVRPLHDRVLVRREEEGEEKIGGIIIPDTAKEKPQRATVEAVAEIYAPYETSRGLAGLWPIGLYR